MAMRVASFVLFGMFSLYAIGVLGFVSDGGLIGLVHDPIQDQIEERKVEDKTGRAQTPARELSQSRQARRDERRAPESAEDAVAELAKDKDSAPSLIGDSLADTAKLLLWPLALLASALVATWMVWMPALALLAALSSRRHRARRNRRMVRYVITPGHTDMSPHDRWVRAIMSMHGDLSGQLYERLGFKRADNGELGAPPVTFERVQLVGPTGRRRHLTAIVVPEGEFFERAVRGTVAMAFENAQVTRVEDRPDWVRHVVRLKKRKLFWHGALSHEVGASSRDARIPVADEIAARMHELSGPTVVAMTLTPSTEIFERGARWLWKSREGGLERDRQEGESAGAAGELARTDSRSVAESIANQPLFHVDLRVGGWTRRDAITAANAVDGAARDTNDMRRFIMRVRNQMYRQRLLRAMSNPLPSVFKNVFAAGEVALLWRPISPFQDNVATRRVSVPNLPPPPDVPDVTPEHAGKLAIAKTQKGSFITRRVEDRQRGMAIIGPPGYGKSSLMVYDFCARMWQGPAFQAYWEPKGGASPETSAILSMVPSGRTVRVLDIENPEFGISAWRMSRDERPDPEEIAGLIQEILVETSRLDNNGESAVLGSSKDQIKHAVIAICAMLGTITDPTEEPCFADLLRALQSTDAAATFRAGLIEALGSSGMAGYNETITNLENLQHNMERSTVQTIQRLEAPRNKLTDLTGRMADGVFRHPQRVYLDEMIGAGEILVFKGSQDNPQVSAVIQTALLVLVKRAIQRQLRAPPEERMAVVMHVDEAHIVFNETLEELMEMGRAAGLEATLAWHQQAQILNPKFRATILGFLNSKALFKLTDADARELVTSLQTVWTDSYRADEAIQEFIRIDARQLATLPMHNFIFDMINRGEAVEAFACETLPMQLSAERIAYYVRQQRRRGGFALAEALQPPQRLLDATRTEPEKASAKSIAQAIDDRKRAETERELAPVGAATGAGEGPSDEAPGQFGGVSAEGAVSDGQNPAAPVRPTEVEPKAEPSPVPTNGRGPAAGNGSGGGAVVPATAPRRESPAPSAKPEAAPASPTEGKRTGRQGNGRPGPQQVSGSQLAGEPLGTLPDGKLPTPLAQLERFRNLGANDVTEVLAPAEPKKVTLNREQARILAAVWRLRLVARYQLARHYLANYGNTTAKARITELTDAGLLEIVNASTGRGKPPQLLRLTERGLTELAKWAPNDAELRQIVSPEPKFNPSRIRHPEAINAQLLIADVVFQLEDLLGESLRGWQGEYGAMVRPPQMRVPRPGPDEPRYRQKGVSELSVMSGVTVTGISDEWQAIRPDAAFEISYELAEEEYRGDLFIEVERSGRAHREGFRKKLVQHDAFVTGWLREVERYKGFPRPPKVLVLVDSEAKARAMATLADRLLTGALAMHGKPAIDWYFPGRENIHFGVISDLYVRTMRCYRAPALPLEVRVSQARNRRERDARAKVQLRQSECVPRGALKNPAY